MPRLPGVEDFGSRPAPRAQRSIASVQNAGAVGRATEQFGATLSGVGEAIVEREATAQATERDVLVSDQIRDLLYNPETGFAGLQGQAAVSSRNTALERLQQLRTTATEGLNAPAAQRLNASLERRISGAMDTIESHTLRQRDAWLDSASTARLNSAQQDALADPSQTASALAVIESETRAEGYRGGWSAEETANTLAARRSGVYRSQAERLAASDPISAMEYVRQNDGQMLPSDIADLEAVLQPEVKRAVGRQIGAEVFGAPERMTTAIEVASDYLGMNESEQRDALAEFLQNGGANLDPSVTAWCAAFVNASLAGAGSQGTGRLNARSFLDWGDEVSEPQRGDVVVLSRGDPDGWQGHVGFFDGFDENGQIRILGGNQGDSVSVQSYDPARLLGYRRMPQSAQPPQGGLERLLEIADPRERAAAIDEYNLRMGVADGQRQARRSEAQAAAFEMIEAGGSLADLPLSFRQSLGQEAMTSLRSYQGAVARGAPVETDDEAYYALRQMQANDPQGFRDLDMLVYRDRLGDSDWQKLVDDQTRPSTGITRTAASTLMTTASRQMNAAGIDTTPDEGSQDAQMVASIQTRLLRWQDQFVEQNSRAPTQTEIDAQVSQELVPVVLNPRGFRNEQDRVIGGLDYSDMTLDGLLDSDLTIGGSAVPVGVVSEAIEVLQRALGRAPTPEEVVDAISATRPR